MGFLRIDLSHLEDFKHRSKNVVFLLPLLLVISQDSSQLPTTIPTTIPPFPHPPACFVKIPTLWPVWHTASPNPGAVRCGHTRAAADGSPDNILDGG